MFAFIASFFTALSPIKAEQNRLKAETEALIDEVSAFIGPDAAERARALLHGKS